MKWDVDIPASKVRAVSEGGSIEKELLGILSFCCGREIISGEPVADMKYDDCVGPVERTVFFGDRSYGLLLKAAPIISGVGVHGEEGVWKFYGLPPGITIGAKSRLDMRGWGRNFFSLEMKGDNTRIGECIEYAEENFAREIKKIIG
ncbi:MAG: hypothetical protein GY754_24355 [bacterium]|nr:hypothetical protein [bacterium]